MKITEKQVCVDLMGEHIFKRFEKLMNKDKHQDAMSLFQEWNVNMEDPEDGNYQFLFINDLTEV
jgi:hypothetical protein